ncbi:hypothetical protein Tther_02437 [Tepidimonas thermarum]|uniref:Uncharacterized protein n=1 Tax=Tepidimonas thermarum TaxID=335431 RepID=A0A554WWQ8_9BURK|nr:hypothetical protein [Tepidimonas thermarum]TSE28003.1 hypothetical protein Tther_02437 [Tepidimonas thermarum]
MAVNEQDLTQTETLPPREAVEQLGVALTEALHQGYGINDGGGGTITISLHGYIDIDAYDNMEYDEEGKH